MAQGTLSGIESALERALTRFFGVKPKIDPTLYGDQMDAPNNTDFDGVPYEYAVSGVDLSQDQLAIVLSDPVPVIHKASDSFSAQTVNVGPTPTRIVNANPNRVRCRIINFGDYSTAFKSIAVSGDSNVTQRALGGGNGFQLLNVGYGFLGGDSNSATIELATTGDVWAVSDGGTYTVSVLEEFVSGGTRVG